MNKCVICSKEYTPRSSRKNSKYCSPACYFKRARIPMWATKDCDFCNKEFKYRSKFKDKRFCSLSCTGKFGNKDKKSAFEKPCEICGKPLKTIPSRVREGRGKYCSKVCYWKGMSVTQKERMNSEEMRVKLSEVQRGEKSHTFKDGKSYKYTHYGSGFNNLLREKVRQRDNNTCQECGVTNKRLEIHHVDLNQRNHDLNNLILLCSICHHSIH